MDYKIINCDSLLKKITRKDKLFSGNYCVDPYQNCEFGCSYCDSSFDKTIYIKNNSDKILESELKNTKKGTVIIGYVHDPYQKIEEKFEKTKKILNVIKKYNFKCHIITKSDLIQRDIDILSNLDCNVTISFLSLDENISNIFEKKVPTPTKRIKVLDDLKRHNIKSGVALIPILPYIIDEELESIIKTFKKHNADYFLYKYLELKGDQKILFNNIIRKNYPNFIEKYQEIYKDIIKPERKSVSDIDNKIRDLLKKYSLKNKID
jgi:DNA repair photolyase